MTDIRLRARAMLELEKRRAAGEYDGSYRCEVENVEGGCIMKIDYGSEEENKNRIRTLFLGGIDKDSI